jgi:hypothetical protein
MSHDKTENTEMTSESERNGEEEETKQQSTSRRALISSAVAVAAAGASGYWSGIASGQSAPSGTIGADEPYERAYIHRQVFIGRTSDPSSPPDGTMWYREDL